MKAENFGQTQNRTGDTRIFSLEKAFLAIALDYLKLPKSTQNAGDKKNLQEKIVNRCQPISMYGNQQLRQYSVKTRYHIREPSEIRALTITNRMKKDRKSNPKKKHHHLSKFYIKGFSKNDKLLFVFSIEEQKISQSNPKDAFTKRKYYYLDDFEDPLTVEDTLMKLESEVAPIVKRICTDSEFLIKLTETESDFLLQWISWLYISRPKYRDLMDDHLEQIEKVARDLLLDKDVKEEESAFMQHIKASKGNRVAHIGRTVNLHEDIFLFLKGLQWRAIALTNDLELITSDSPFYRIPNFQQGQIPVCYDPRLHLILLFPLSKKCLLIGSGREISTTFDFDTLVSRENIQHINSVIFGNAHKFVVSSNRKILNSFLQ